MADPAVGHKVAGRATGEGVAKEVAIRRAAAAAIDLGVVLDPGTAVRIPGPG